MKRNKLISAPALMVLSILLLTAFQLYWLQQNYAREKKSLNIKAEVNFRETMMGIQVSKLKLDRSVIEDIDSNTGRNVKFIVKDKEGNINMGEGPRQEIISTIDVFRGKLNDSMSLRTDLKPGTVITMNRSSIDVSKDSIRVRRFPRFPADRNGHMINLLYGIDSLQDSIRVAEVDSAYALQLKKEKINVPYTILKYEGDTKDRGEFNKVTVGLAHPVTYELKLGNTFSYLIKQILQPILFSIMLLGITVLSFVLLYRNLLKQRRLSELKNEFISNITHELKTPIATVGVAIEALKNFNAIDDPARTREYLDISQNELQRLGLLVDKVLKLSMFEKKEVELKYEMINLADLVNEVVSSLKLQLEKHRARVSVETDGEVTIQGDRLHLLSVVFNLLDNALKYSKGEPSIQVGVAEKEDKVVLSFTDNGIGIAPEYKDKLFDKFFRVPHGDTHNAKGYGLGLSYVAEVIRKHNGTIEVESQPGIGTKFIISIPKMQ